MGVIKTSNWHVEISHDKYQKHKFSNEIKPELMLNNTRAKSGYKNHHAHIKDVQFANMNITNTIHIHTNNPSSQNILIHFHSFMFYREIFMVC